MISIIQSKNFLTFFDTTKTSPMIGAINSTFSGGACLGALFGGITMDRFGRRGTIGVGAVICTVGVVLQTAAYQYVLHVLVLFPVHRG